MKHTATPWRILGNRNSQLGVPIIAGEGSETVRVATIYGSDSISDSQDEANAAYIATCANSHEQLIEAASRVRKMCQYIIELSDKATLNNARQQADQAVKELDAALALAEGDATEGDGLEMHDNSCLECGHPYKVGDEMHYFDCSRATGADAYRSATEAGVTTASDKCPDCGEKGYSDPADCSFCEDRNEQEAERL